MKNRKTILSLLGGCTAILLICSSSGGTAGYNSSGRHLSPGATIELTQSVKFPYRGNRVYIQGGEVLGRKRDATKFEPFCSFGLNRKRDNKPQISEISPDIFTVQNTRTWVTASRDSHQRVQVASNGNPEDLNPLLAYFMGGGDTPSRFTYHTEFSLNSEQQPQVDDLTCAYDDYRGVHRGRHLTIDQMRDTLGGLVRINE